MRERERKREREREKEEIVRVNLAQFLLLITQDIEEHEGWRADNIHRKVKMITISISWRAP